MEELLKYIIENIVDHKDEVKIERIDESAESVLFKVYLNTEDKGLVIGKQGRNIMSIKNLLNILARKEGKKIFIKIED